MPIEAIVTLQDLECITLKNTESKVEPYIWPVLIKVDTSTIGARDGRFADVIALSPSVASVVIKSSMQQGDLAPIPASVSSLRTRFEDGVAKPQLILIVALLERDDTPKGAMRAGFEAYVSELRAAFKEEGPKLFQAESVNDAEGVKKIIERIKARIETKTRAAIKNALSPVEKAATAFGSLDHDDFVSSSVTQFRESFFENTPNATPITLVFQAKGFVFNLPQLPPTLARYHIRARLEARPPVIDACQSQVNAVRAAKVAVDNIEKEMKRLQNIAEHQFPKGNNDAEIERIREEELPPALAQLGKAQSALQLCRSQQN